MKIRHHQRKIFFLLFIKSVFKPKDSGFAGFRSTVLPVNIIPIYPVHTSSLDVILGVYLRSCGTLFMFWPRISYFPQC